jgi:hypothetical protein
MMAEDPDRRPLQLVRAEETSVLRVPDELRPIPSWTDVALVLAVCLPFWAGLTWLVSAWL